MIKDSREVTCDLCERVVEPSSYKTMELIYGHTRRCKLSKHFEVCFDCLPNDIQYFGVSASVRMFFKKAFTKLAGSTK